MSQQNVQMKVKGIVLIAALAIILYMFTLTSCVAPGVKIQAPDCPEPPQGCYNTKWSGVPLYDTNSSVEDGKSYYIIDNVYGLSTPDDDWHLSFINSSQVFFTFSESGINRTMTAIRQNVNNFSIDKGVKGLPDAHIGIFSSAASNVVFSSSQSSNNGFVKKHIYDELATLEAVTGKSRIYKAIYKNGEITNIDSINDSGIQALDWSGHPAFSNNGKVIFFSSDRANGVGGNDIWLMIMLDNGNYSEPINLGNNLNSRCDEISPFISSDNKRIYFASAGHQTVGGYDIFYSEINDSLWKNLGTYNSNTDLSSYFTAPINLGAPLNTEKDELFPSCPGNCSDTIYYSSNQNAESQSLVASLGGFDLFVAYKTIKPLSKNEIAKRNEKKKDLSDKPNMKSEQSVDLVNNNKIVEKQPVTIQGKVFDKSNNNAVDSAIVSLKSDDRKIPDVQVLTDKYGKFDLPVKRNTQYEITAQKKEYYFDSKRILISEDYDLDTTELNFYLPEIGVIRINFPTDEYKNPYKFTLDTNGVETGRIWSNELKLVAENLLMAIDRIDRIVLVGHTDDVGSDEYNIGLGQRRVDFVINELIKLGVPENKLYGRSAGERESIERNKSEDLNTYRKRLRRVTMEKFFVK